MASNTKGTLAQYAKPIRLWLQYCKENQIDWFSPPVASVMSFLGKYFAKVEYNTLNSYRSAISLITNVNLGQNELLKRFFKGCSALKPPKSKYALTWNPDSLLSYLSTQWPNEGLNLEQLTRKLVTLLILISSQRAQTLSLIRRNNIHFGADSVIIKIADRIKTTRANKEQPIISIDYFKDKPELCVASLLRFYIDKTAQLIASDVEFLFVSFRMPYKPITSQTISRWVKQTMKEGGVDTDIFSAHSTRHASSSAAARAGVNLDVIRKTAGWTANSQTFARFYNRPIAPSMNVARALILNNN